MGFTLFKKKRSESTSPSAPRSPQLAPPGSPAMATSASSPSLSHQSRLGSAPSSPAFQSSNGFSAPIGMMMSPDPNMLKLRVVVDPLLSGTKKLSLGEAKDLFYIHVHREDPIDTIKKLVAAQLECEDILSVGCYKVHIPWAAHFQSKSYAQRYEAPVNLISHFSACNLDDATQIAHSLQQHDHHMDRPHVKRREPSRSRHTTPKTVGDWWPDGVDNKEGVISVLVRLAELEMTDTTPLTLLAHFNIPRSLRPAVTPDSPKPGASSSASTFVPIPPTAFDISRDCTVLQLKAQLLKADYRKAEALDKIILWRVDMTWKEMLDCESFGGLRDGGMPWPYPPNASAPTPLNDDRAVLSSIFKKPSDPNLISIYAWIPPSVEALLAKPTHVPSSTPGSTATEPIPNFCYPMINQRGKREAGESSPVSFKSPKSTASPVTRDDGLLAPKPSSSRSTSSRSSRRGARPSTAPAIIPSHGAPSSSLPAFGQKTLMKRSPSARECSPLSSAPITASNLTSKDGLGLGIGDIDVNTTPTTPVAPESATMTALSPPPPRQSSLKTPVAVMLQVSPPTPSLSHSSTPSLSHSDDSKGSSQAGSRSSVASFGSCFQSTGSMSSDVDDDLAALFDSDFESDGQSAFEPKGQNYAVHAFGKPKGMKAMPSHETGGSAAMMALRMKTLQVSYRN